MLTAAQRRALIDELQVRDEVERRACSGRLEPFLQRYLGSQFSEHPGAFHRAIYADLEAMVGQEQIEGEMRDSGAYAYPRGHGKTTTITLGFALWVISEWRRMAHFRGAPPFILIVSDTKDQARDRAMDLRDELEGNVELAREYGDQVPRGDQPGDRALKWTEADWTTRSGVRVKAVGAGSKVRGLLRRGRRPTLILIDDLENDEAVATQARRRKLERWLQKALIPVGIEGHLLTVMVGTILHADSLLSRLLDPAKYEGWLKRRFAAIYNDSGLPDATGAHALWPAFWPLYRLLARKRKIGSVAFAQEYLNIPLDDETALFQWDWLQRARARGREIPFLYGSPARIPFDLVVSTWDYAELAGAAEPGAYQVVVTGWDLGLVDDEETAREKDSDYSVGITVGLDACDRLHVRRIYRKRGMTPAQLRERIIAEQGVVGADYVAVENNAAQKIIEIDLRGVPNLPIIGHTTGTKKHSVYEGVPGLALLYELGRIDHCAAREQERARLDVLEAELHGLGHEAHDDCVMALWIAVSTIRRWQRRRDARRLKLLGPAPAGYVNAFPTREDEGEARRAA